MLQIGALEIDDDVVRFNETDVPLTPGMNLIFNRLALADGEPVSFQEFIDAGEACNQSTLAAQVSKIRDRFKPFVSRDVVFSTSYQARWKKSGLIGGYALNKNAFNID